eukprot:672179-Rhodomonas_salina.3
MEMKQHLRAKWRSGSRRHRPTRTSKDSTVDSDCAARVMIDVEGGTEGRSHERSSLAYRAYRAYRA